MDEHEQLSDCGPTNSEVSYYGSQQSGCAVYCDYGSGFGYHGLCSPVSAMGPKHNDEMDMGMPTISQLKMLEEAYDDIEQVHSKW